MSSEYIGGPSWGTVREWGGAQRAVCIVRLGRGHRNLSRPGRVEEERRSSVKLISRDFGATLCWEAALYIHGALAKASRKLRAGMSKASRKPHFLFRDFFLVNVWHRTSQYVQSGCCAKSQKIHNTRYIIGGGKRIWSVLEMLSEHSRRSRRKKFCCISSLRLCSSKPKSTSIVKYATTTVLL